MVDPCEDATIEALSKLMSMKTLPGTDGAPSTPEAAASSAAYEGPRKIYSTRFPITYGELRESKRGSRKDKP